VPRRSRSAASTTLLGPAVAHLNMGVVRREGDWRLEKREDGVYEVSFDREPKVRIVTAERDEQVLDADTLGQVVVRQVTDYDDVTDAFEEYVERDDPATVGPLGRTRVDPGGGEDEGAAATDGETAGEGDGAPAAEDGPRRRGTATSSGRRRRRRDGDGDDAEGDSEEAPDEEQEGEPGPATGARVAGGLAGTLLAFGGGVLAGGAGLASTAGVAGVGLAVVGALSAAWAAMR